MEELPLPEIDGMSLVLVGSFNPRIFTPAWFVRNGLLSQGVEESANVEIVANDICIFETDWFRLEVLGDRLALTSQTVPTADSLRDLLAGALRVLRHTPVTKLGLNTHAHYRLPTLEAWNEFGHSLAPKSDFWTPIMKEPGTLSLSIQGERPDSYEGHTRVKVEPSAKVEFGIFIDTNDEYRKESQTAEWVDTVLVDQWETSRVWSTTARNHLLKHALGWTK